MIANVLQFVGLILTGIGLFYVAYQLSLSRKVNESQFMFQIFNLMDNHNQIHLKLSKFGFDNGTFEPQTEEDWLQIGRIMGLFEHINNLVESGVLDISTVDNLYSYRLIPIVKNEFILKKHLDMHKTGWEGLKRLNKNLKKCSNYKNMLKNFNQPFINNTKNN